MPQDNFTLPTHKQRKDIENLINGKKHELDELHHLGGNIFARYDGNVITVSDGDAKIRTSCISFSPDIAIKLIQFIEKVANYEQ